MCLHSSPSRRRADAAFKLVQRKVKVAPPRERLAPLLRLCLAVPRPRAPPGPRAPRDVAHLLRAQAGERREPARRVLGRVRHEASLDSRVAQEVARVALCCLLASFTAASQVACERCCSCQECEGCILLEVGGRQLAFLVDSCCTIFGGLLLYFFGQSVRWWRTCESHRFVESGPSVLPAASAIILASTSLLHRNDGSSRCSVPRC